MLLSRTRVMVLTNRRKEQISEILGKETCQALLIEWGVSVQAKSLQSCQTL